MPKYRSLGPKTQFSSECYWEYLYLLGICHDLQLDSFTTKIIENQLSSRGALCMDST